MHGLPPQAFFSPESKVTGVQRENDMLERTGLHLESVYGRTLNSDYGFLILS